MYHHCANTYISAATNKSLNELEERRQKRDAEEEDFKLRIENLLKREEEINKIRSKNAVMLNDLKKRVKKARKIIATE